jgi:hypothetical protein
MIAVHLVHLTVLHYIRFCIAYVPEDSVVHEKTALISSRFLLTLMTHSHHRSEFRQFIHYEWYNSIKI